MLGCLIPLLHRAPPGTQAGSRWAGVHEQLALRRLLDWRRRRGELLRVGLGDRLRRLVVHRRRIVLAKQNKAFDFPKRGELK